MTTPFRQRLLFDFATKRKKEREERKKDRKTKRQKGTNIPSKDSIDTAYKTLPLIPSSLFFLQLLTVSLKSDCSYHSSTAVATLADRVSTIQTPTVCPATALYRENRG
jgi:hypothetical protein